MCLIEINSSQLQDYGHET